VADTERRLNDRLEDEMLQHDEGETGWGTIDTREKAAWASRRLAKYERSKAEVEAWAKREIDRIKKIASDETTSIEASAEWFRGQLEGYLLSQVDEGRTGKKSMLLPGGKIALRKTPDTFIVEDDEAVADRLEHLGLGGCVKTTKKVLKRQLARFVTTQGTVAVVTDTGEIIEGVSVQPGHESFTFTPVDAEEE